ncbi:sigma-70 family RNA polymerase sigma factor [Thalassomonas sp. M1454]|nr:sigma-70 family RNA polymerase sigma factor [Thalassomonas sp. M1454]
MNMNDDIDHKELADWLTAVGQDRDKQAFTCLFKFFSPKILRIAGSKFNTQNIANEIVQETMTNVWRKAHLYNADKGAPTTWVYTVMRNVSFDLLRKIQSKKEDTLSDDIWPTLDVADESENEFEDHFESQKVLSLLDSLPEKQQQVIKGFYLMEMSQEQLAKHLNLPLGTVKSRLRLALNKLKQQVDLQLGDNHD